MADNVNQYDNGSGPGPGGPGNNGGQGGPGGPGSSGSGDPRKQSLIMLVVAALITLLCISAFMKMMTGATNQEITYNEFIQMVESGKVKNVQVGSDRITIYPKTEQKETSFLYNYSMGSITYYTGKMEDDDTLALRLLEHNVEMKKEVSDSSSVIMTVLLYYILPVLLMWGLLSLLFRRMGGQGWSHGCGKEYRESLCAEGDGYHLQGCGRGGRGEGITGRGG